MNVRIQRLAPYFCALTLLVLSSVSAQAKQSVDEKMAADPNGSVEIEHQNGRAKVIGWDKSEVSVVGELGDNTEEFQFERNGSSIVIHVKAKKNRSWGNWGSNDGDNGDYLTIHVPKNSKVEYTSVNADVDVNNIHGGLSVTVVNGNMDIEDLSGRIRLQSVNGDIDADKLNGDLAIETVNGDIDGKQMNTQGSENELKVSTVNGDIEMESNSTEVEAETVNGSIELNLQEVEELELNTVNGSIDVQMHLLADGSVDASSVGGTIELIFQKGVGARFDIEAHAGGSIKNKITDDKQKRAEHGPRRWLEFSTANPTASVEVSTVHGNIRLNTK